MTPPCVAGLARDFVAVELYEKLGRVRASEVVDYTDYVAQQASTTFWVTLAVGYVAWALATRAFMVMTRRAERSPDVPWHYVGGAAAVALLVLMGSQLVLEKRVFDPFVDQLAIAAAKARMR
jgi:hypothetical protein